MGVRPAVAATCLGVTQPRLIAGRWKGLFKHALSLIDEIARGGVAAPFWTFGGGTVLMLRYRHRRSNDIDIFVPDPQYLAYVTPRLNSLAETISADYIEAADHVKLIRPEGEIDFVVAPNLTSPGFEMWRIAGREIRVETAVEIVAKKMWYRGDTATARDLFDLSLLIGKERKTVAGAARWLVRHRNTFLSQLHSREIPLRAQFDALDTLSYRPIYDDCVRRVERFLESLPA
jgi:Nucleotidyl transferase AbiEii toxin, Type IV TA system